MIDPELKNEFDRINRNLVGILHKTESWWRAFVNGVLRGIGSVVGVALALLLIGWFLNTVGVIPAFREQAREWQQTLEEIKRIR